MFNFEHSPVIKRYTKYVRIMIKMYGGFSTNMKEITSSLLFRKPDGSYGIETFESLEAGTIIGPGVTKMFYIPKVRYNFEPIGPIITPTD